MLLPNYFFILLVTLPILIEGIPQQHKSRSELQECSEDSKCRQGSFCNLDRCVACQKAGCGIGSICGNTTAGKFGCECPVNTQGDPKVECHFITECSNNSQCTAGTYCSYGSCSACNVGGCGPGSNCRENQAGKFECFCPVKTQGDPKVQCIPVTGCDISAQCGKNEICKGKRCVAHPCLTATCGSNNKCILVKGEIQCQPIPANVVGDRTQASVAQGTNHGGTDQEGQQVVTTPGANQGRPKEKPLNAATQPPTTSKIPTSHSGTDDVGFPGDNSGQRKRNGCLNTPNPGECRAAFKRFYYNIETDQCDCFLFGGCDEEVEAKYSWVTLEECQQKCLPGNKSQGPGCKRASLEEVTAFLEEERRRRENNSN